MRRKLIKSSFRIRILFATFLTMAGCDWDNDIILGDDRTDSDPLETETLDATTDGGDTATETESDSDSDIVKEPPDSASDSEHNWDDSEHSHDEDALRVGVVMPPPGDVEKWDKMPNELCVFILKSRSPWPPDLFELTKDAVSLKCIDEFDREFLLEPLVPEEWGEWAETYHYELVFSFDDLNEAGPLMDIVAVLYMDGSHESDVPQAEEDYIRYWTDPAPEPGHPKNEPLKLRLEYFDPH